MDRVLIDTDIISYFFKGNKKVVSNIEIYLNHFKTLEISVITYYEIIGGLLAKNAFKQLDVFNQFIAKNVVIPLTEESAGIAAEIYSTLKKKGEILDDIDLLIAGIAIANDLTLVTNNEKHFNRIPGLKVENWSK